MNDFYTDFDDLTVLLSNWNNSVTAAQGNVVNPGGTVPVLVTMSGGDAL